MGYWQLFSKPRSRHLKFCRAKLSGYRCEYGLHGGLGVPSKISSLVQLFRCCPCCQSLFYMPIFEYKPPLNALKTWKLKFLYIGFQVITGSSFWTHVFCIHLLSKENIFHWIRSRDLILHLVKILVYSLHTCFDMPQRSTKGIWAPSLYTTPRCKAEIDWKSILGLFPILSYKHLDLNAQNS